MNSRLVQARHVQVIFINIIIIIITIIIVVVVLVYIIMIMKEPTLNSRLLQAATLASWAKASSTRPLTRSQLGDSGINLKRCKDEHLERITKGLLTSNRRGQEELPRSR